MRASCCASAPGDFALDERTYFEIIGGKTACLIGLACEMGARFSGADDETIRRLGEFGTRVGLAFQITDDLLDLVGDEETVGKSLGKDIEKGKLTLPMIHHLASLDARERGVIVESLSRGGAGMRVRDERCDRASAPDGFGSVRAGAGGGTDRRGEVAARGPGRVGSAGVSA
ncbi:MAG: polyprenyl synthetase family protein [Phycisphaerales bacterium]